MPTYHITWEIDLSARSHREAAESALEMQRDPESTATVFMVRDVSTGTEPVRVCTLHPDSANMEGCCDSYEED